MPFIELSGLKGKVYVPEVNRETPKKHACEDCYACQMCSDDRCRICQSSQKSIAENSGMGHCQ